VIATTSSEAKARRLRELGADEVIDYRATPDWHERVRELTGGAGVDHVVETTGRLVQSIQSAATEGEIAFVGLLSNDTGLPSIDAKLLWMSGTDIRTESPSAAARSSRPWPARSRWAASSR
jgi:NADPH:quinone reductase-like Zn-dependent oxidoreductase